MPITKVCHISTFSPTQCGIATYAEDLIGALKGVGCSRVRLVRANETTGPNPDIKIVVENVQTYYEAAEAINSSSAEVVSLQHEFGIYGGDNGEQVLTLVEEIDKPIVTTLHTTHTEISPARARITEEVVRGSRFVVTLTEESGQIISSKFGVPEDKIRVIRHGIPGVDFVLPRTARLRDTIGTPLLFVSAGHLRPTKGYEIALQALARYQRCNPHFKYLILGTDQAHRDVGASEYRSQLKSQVEKLHLEDKVIWIDKYLDLELFLEYIKAADIGLVTYTRPYQSSSGILPLILGCGRLVVATAFHYAKSVAKQVHGMSLADMDSPESVSEGICRITESQTKMHSLMRSNYRTTREWLWKNAAVEYRIVFQDALVFDDVRPTVLLSEKHCCEHEEGGTERASEKGLG